MKLSVIIPVYNEENTIEKIINKINQVNIDKELIIVDDGSTDKTKKILKNLACSNQQNIKIIFHSENKGKGTAIKTGLNYVTGEIIIIQDADLEYDPNDYIKLVEPIKRGATKVVYGSRNLADNPQGKKIYTWGGIFLSHLANLLYGIKITDEPTCYKVFKTDVIKSLNLKCKRFEFCPEVTAKLAKQKFKIIEVPISYQPRNHKAGKKINLQDGLQAMWTLIKYRFMS